MPLDPNKPLPQSAQIAVRDADKNIVLRILPAGQDPEVLPAEATAFVPGPRTAGGVIVSWVLMLAVTVGGVWLITGNAWDDDGFFPWFWNPLWAVFPWIFLLPIWALFLRAQTAAPRDAAFRDTYARLAPTARPQAGRVIETRLLRDDTGGVGSYAARVAFADRTIAVGRMAEHGRSIGAYEMPETGAPVVVFDLGTIIIVQGGRIRAGNVQQAATPSAATGDAALSAELARLAELHASGALSDEEFALAKRRALGA